MCGRFSLTESKERIKEHYRLDSVPEIQPRFNISPSQEALVVYQHPESLKSIAFNMHWGLGFVVEGYIKIGANGKQEEIPGVGGGFQYCSLGETLFDSTGQIAKTVSFIDLARFVFFKETGLPLPDEISGNSPLIGTHNGTGVYLLYNGILGDKTPQGGNALTRAVLADLPPYDGPKVVYGTSCRVGLARLKQENMIFRQIPYELKVD